jgi:hypothetical protein
MENMQQIPEANQPAQSASVPSGRPTNQRSHYPKDSRSKSTALAAILSAMPGLGQVYVGYYQQGFINVLVVGSLIALLAAGIGSLQPLAGIFLAFFWLYNIVDAYRRALLYNQTLAGLGPTELPDDVKAPGSQGSLLGGSLLIAFGLLALAHTKFGYPLDWVEDWWPAALVLIGAYLVYQSFRDTQAESSD